jgi:hypothetical protein
MKAMAKIPGRGWTNIRKSYEYVDKNKNPKKLLD